jgi:uncharacterized protein YcbX
VTPTVSRLAITPVKGLGLLAPDRIDLGLEGVPGNRRFYLVGEDGRLFSGLDHGPLVRVVPSYEPDGERLALRFPDGHVVDGEVELGEAKVTAFWERPVRGRYVEGPWSDALSDYVGKWLRLIRVDDEQTGYDSHPVSILGDASVEELARRSGADGGIDARRFRMLVHVAGTGPHEEDEWIGRRVRIGEASVRVVEQNARCATTTHNPDSGRRDFDALRQIADYRGLRDGKRIDFGVLAEVEEPGRIRVGDPVDVEA